MKVNKFLFFLLKLTVSGASLWLIFSKTDINRMLLMMKKIGPVYFFFAAVLYILSQVFSTLRWKLLLPDRFGFRRLFSLYLIGGFFNSFLPGVIGGDVVKAYYLNRDARKVSLTLASIFMDRYLGYVSLIMIGIIAFPFALPYFGSSPYRWVMPFIFFSFVTGSLLFFGLQLGRRFRVVSELYDYFDILSTRKEIIIKAVGFSTLVQFMSFFAVGLLAYAMGEKIPFLLLIVFLPIVNTITTVPISISGLGVREGAFVLLFGLIGVNEEAATILSLSWFFSTFLGSLPGLFFYLRQSDRPEAPGNEKELS